MKPSLAIDLDGVVVNFFDELLRIYNTEVEENLSIDSIDYDFEILPVDVSNRMREIFNREGYFESLEALPNAINILNKFRDLGFPSIICTAPARDLNGLINGRSAAEKYNWVQKHLPAWGNDVMITKDKYYTNTNMLIDDFPPNISLWCAANPAGVGYLIDQPWNKRFSHYPPNAVRGPLERVISFVDKFWCEERRIFAYRLEELRSWR